MRCTLSGGGPKMGPWAEEKAAATFASFSFTFCPSHLPCFYFLVLCHLFSVASVPCAMPVHLSPSLLSSPTFLLLPSCLVQRVSCVKVLLRNTCGTQRMACNSQSCCQLPAVAGGSHGRLSSRLDLLFSKSGKSLGLLLVLPTPLRNCQ